MERAYLEELGCFFLFLRNVFLVAKLIKNANLEKVLRKMLKYESLLKVILIGIHCSKLFFLLCHKCIEIFSLC